MIEIKEGQKLEINNLLSFRGKIKQDEMENIVEEMEKFIIQEDAVRLYPSISTTYMMEGELIDIEILIPINRRIEGDNKYLFKDKLLICNAVVVRHSGNSESLQKIFSELNQYIIHRELQPITTAYSVTQKKDVLNSNDYNIDIYIGVSNNIL